MQRRSGVVAIFDFAGRHRGASGGRRSSLCAAPTP